MSTSEDRGRLAEDVKLSHEAQVDLAKILNEKGYSNANIAHILRLPENVVRTMVETPVINWGYNCLTAGIHHGRPEALWNLPLLYAATVLFDRESLKQIVLDRIYNDAMQIVNEKVDLAQFDAAWAQRVRDHAEQFYMTRLQHKVGELSQFYKRPEKEKSNADVAQRVTEGTLNPGYQPLHSHDSINMLCRILGSSASRAVS